MSYAIYDLNSLLQQDCNSAHIQPSGKYHYHGSPMLFLDAMGAPRDAMTQIGYAADGFPNYYK